MIDSSLTRKLNQACSIVKENLALEQVIKYFYTLVTLRQRHTKQTNEFLGNIFESKVAICAIQRQIFFFFFVSFLFLFFFFLMFYILKWRIMGD